MTPVVIRILMNVKVIFIAFRFCFLPFHPRFSRSDKVESYCDFYDFLINTKLLRDQKKGAEKGKTK